MTAAEYLRTRDACERFGVSRWTLARWADAGRIGRTRIGGVVRYRASDIAELMEAHTTPRAVVPMVAPPAATSASDWRSDPFWREAAR